MEDLRLAAGRKDGKLEIFGLQFCVCCAVITNPVCAKYRAEIRKKDEE